MDIAALQLLIPIEGDVSIFVTSQMLRSEDGNYESGDR
jgi:hypothetical protein